MTESNLLIRNLLARIVCSVIAIEFSSGPRAMENSVTLTGYFFFPHISGRWKNRFQLLSHEYRVSVHFPDHVRECDLFATVCRKFYAAPLTRFPVIPRNVSPRGDLGIHRDSNPLNHRICVSFERTDLLRAIVQRSSH